MTTGKLVTGAAALVLALGALALLALAGRRPGPVDASDRITASPSPTPSAPSRSGSTASDPQTARGFLYGRVLTDDGTAYRGRLRWGGGEEAFWGDTFNGAKTENPWVDDVDPERLEESRPIEVFGVEVVQRKRRIDLSRPFMARFGDITRLEVSGRDLRVTLKSGTLFHLDRYGADDFADGLRVWDEERGVVDLPERRVRAVELLATPALNAVPDRLHGTVRTEAGEFTGFVQWNRESCVGSDELHGRADDAERSLRFDALRSIERVSRDSSRVTLLDGAQLVLSGTPQVGRNHRGVFVEDPRYGRVLVPWEAFERVDFSPGGSGPGYDDFPPGDPLSGSVTTRDGRRLAGRLVYDLDESESTETLDAPSRGVDYTLLFGLIASIELPELGAADPELARVSLHSGEELLLERRGDLGDQNAGLLVFGEGRPEYVEWSDVRRIDLERPPAMFPPLPGKL